MNIFIICPVRNATDEQKKLVADYIKKKENEGNTVYYPARDTDQTDPIGFAICDENFKGMRDADEVHIFWDEKSSGSLFDLGMAFALRKPLKGINEVWPTAGKSFQYMIIWWSNHGVNESYSFHKRQST